MSDDMKERANLIDTGKKVGTATILGAVLGVFAALWYFFGR